MEAEYSRKYHGTVRSGLIGYAAYFLCCSASFTENLFTRLRAELAAQNAASVLTVSCVLCVLLFCDVFLKLEHGLQNEIQKYEDHTSKRQRLHVSGVGL